MDARGQMMLSPGDVIAGYEIEGYIARGGMAVVYRARESSLGRRVALKLIAPELAGNDKFRQRFIRESELAASIDHPNVLPIYAAGEASGILYIAMRYVDGEDLGRRIASAGRLDPAEVLPLFTQVAAALDTAHTHGLIHRDVKPGNILIARTPGGPGLPSESHVYLTDFGLTKKSSSLSGFTTAGHFIGTIAYVAPEQIAGHEVTRAADVYAMGCVLYEALSGAPPFQRDDDAAMLWAHMSSMPEPLAGFVPGIPAAVDAVIARAMAKDPSRRTSSCRSVVAELRDAFRSGRPPATPDDGPFALGQRRAPTSSFDDQPGTSDPLLTPPPPGLAAAAAASAPSEPYWQFEPSAEDRAHPEQPPPNDGFDRPGQPDQNDSHDRPALRDRSGRPDTTGRLDDPSAPFRSNDPGDVGRSDQRPRPNQPERPDRTSHSQQQNQPDRADPPGRLDPARHPHSPEKAGNPPPHNRSDALEPSTQRDQPDPPQHPGQHVQPGAPERPTQPDRAGAPAPTGSPLQHGPAGPTPLEGQKAEPGNRRPSRPPPNRQPPRRVRSGVLWTIALISVTAILATAFIMVPRWFTPEFSRYRGTDEATSWLAFDRPTTWGLHSNLSKTCFCTNQYGGVLETGDWATVISAIKAGTSVEGLYAEQTPRLDLEDASAVSDHLDAFLAENKKELGEPRRTTVDDRSAWTVEGTLIAGKDPTLRLTVRYLMVMSASGQKTDHIVLFTRDQDYDRLTKRLDRVENSISFLENG